MNTFVIEYEVTEKLYIQWYIEAKLEGKRLGYTILSIVLMLACLALFFVFGYDLYYLIIALAFGYVAFLRDFVVAKKTYRKLCSMHGVSSWKRCITVSDSEIVGDDGFTLTRFKTADVLRVAQDDAKLRVFMKEDVSLRLYKNAFTQGAWQDCLSLLAR